MTDAELDQKATAFQNRRELLQGRIVDYVFHLLPLLRERGLETQAEALVSLYGAVRVLDEELMEFGNDNREQLLHRWD
jgi:hypothetical protein